jgi:tricorn protease-like protein
MDKNDAGSPKTHTVVYVAGDPLSDYDIRRWLAGCGFRPVSVDPSRWGGDFHNEFRRWVAVPNDQAGPAKEAVIAWKRSQLAASRTLRREWVWIWLGTPAAVFAATAVIAYAELGLSDRTLVISLDVAVVSVFTVAPLLAWLRAIGRKASQAGADRGDAVRPLTAADAFHTSEGHDTAVVALAFSPDGALVASGSVDETIRLWEAATGKEVLRIEAHAGVVGSVAFSPDGKTLASGGEDFTVRLWDVATGREPQRCEGHEDWVFAVAFSPDGATLASGSGDGTLRMWEAASGREIRKIAGPGGDILGVAYSPDGRTLAAGCEDWSIRLWDADTGTERNPLKGHTDKVFDVAFSPDGRILASGSDDGTVRLWDASTGLEIRSMDGHKKWVRTLAFSPDGKMLASGGWDGAVRVWEAATGRELLVLSKPAGGAVQVVALSPDGKRLLSGHPNGSILASDIAALQVDQETAPGTPG